MPMVPSRTHCVCLALSLFENPSFRSHYSSPRRGPPERQPVNQVPKRSSAAGGRQAGSGTGGGVLGHPDLILSHPRGSALPVAPRASPEIVGLTHTSSKKKCMPFQRKNSAELETERAFIVVSRMTEQPKLSRQLSSWTQFSPEGTGGPSAPAAKSLHAFLSPEAPVRPGSSGASGGSFARVCQQSCRCREPSSEMWVTCYPLSPQVSSLPSS